MFRHRDNVVGFSERDANSGVLVEGPFCVCVCPLGQHIQLHYPFRGLTFNFWRADWYLAAYFVAFSRLKLFWGRTKWNPLNSPRAFERTRLELLGPLVWLDKAFMRLVLHVLPQQRQVSAVTQVDIDTGVWCAEITGAVAKKLLRRR